MTRSVNIQNDAQYHLKLPGEMLAELTAHAERLTQELDLRVTVAYLLRAGAENLLADLNADSTLVP